MGNVKMANITINISTMLVRLLFSTAKHMSSQGTIFNYQYETIRTCARYHRRSWNSLWAKLLTANWKRQCLTRSLCYIFLKPPSWIAKVLISGWECKAAYESIWFFFFVMLFPYFLKRRQIKKTHSAKIHSVPLKVTRPSYFVRVPSYFEALWYPHLYFDRKSNI